MPPLQGASPDEKVVWSSARQRGVAAAASQFELYSKQQPPLPMPHAQQVQPASVPGYMAGPPTQHRSPPDATLGRSDGGGTFQAHPTGPATLMGRMANSAQPHDFLRYGSRSPLVPPSSSASPPQASGIPQGWTSNPYQQLARHQFQHGPQHSPAGLLSPNQCGWAAPSPLPQPSYQPGSPYQPGSAAPAPSRPQPMMSPSNPYQQPVTNQFQHVPQQHPAGTQAGWTAPSPLPHMSPNQSGSTASSHPQPMHLPSGPSQRTSQAASPQLAGDSVEATRSAKDVNTQYCDVRPYVCSTNLFCEIGPKI